MKEKEKRKKKKKRKKEKKRERAKNRGGFQSEPKIKIHKSGGIRADPWIPLKTLQNNSSLHLPRSLHNTNREREREREISSPKDRVFLGFQLKEGGSDTMEEKELEDQLVEAGTKLFESPPSAVDELLNLLNQVESCLLRVEQSPSKSMLTALHPSMKALVAKEILRHSDMDVKVAVASCISEITRITAPDAPYDDDLMKEIFQIIVTAFEKLHDMSGASYSKRVSILETVAKVRSCVVMLDLECDALILEMFHHFLKAIRESHPDNVFSSMETIMTLVLEESEDISSELLSSLLSSVKNENKDVSPIAHRLGEKVIGNCAAKLKPYMMQEVQSGSISLSDYCKIVASICEETLDAPDRNDLNASGQHLADENKLSMKNESDVLPQLSVDQGPEKLEPEACPGEIDPPLDKSSTAVMSNGTIQTADDGSLIDAESPGKKLEHSHDSSQSKITVATTKDETDHLESSKPEPVPDQSIKKTRTRKTSSLTHSTETSDDSLMESEKVAPELPKRKKGRSKEADNSLSEGPSIKEATLPLENEKKPEVLSSARSVDEIASVASPSSNPNQSVPEGTRPRRGRPMSKKKGGANAEADLPGLPSEPKGALLNDQTADDAPQSTDIMSKKEPDGNSDVEAKLPKHSGKKADAGNVNEDEKQPSEDTGSKKDPEGMSDSEEKPLKRFSKVRAGNATGGESSVKQPGDKTKRRKGTPTTDKSITGESSQKKLVSSPKGSRKASIDDQEILKTKSKRSRVPVTEKTAEGPGENLVGSKIKVWWPEDKTYYQGVVASFNPVDHKHEVLYDDGDKENLLLTKEKWELIEGDSALDEEQATDVQSPDASEMRRQKKAKTSSDSSSKLGKTDAPLKRGGASASKLKDVGPKASNKSKGDVTKSGGKQKGDEGKLASKSEDGAPKSGSKSKGDTPKAGVRSKDETSSKSKDDTPKADRKTKDDSPKTSRKSKDDTPKVGSKPKDEAPKAGSKSKDEAPKAGSKSKDEAPKAGSKSKDEAPKAGSKSKDEAPKAGSKSKDEAPKGGSKSKDEAPKSGSKSKDETPKAGGKSKDETPKAGPKSKDETPKAGPKSKDETPKAGPKSNDDTPKAGGKPKVSTTKTSSKSNANGASTKGKSVQSKAKESEDTTKGKSGSSAKAQESESKSGKKRRRGLQG
ncbi:sister chromatid cohesion protein PDS5 homolog C-like [Magnolia sinica]|uniref:sister chromatid cohesion protein PDS5 homolog C-like n=1 Tax=Magnolia sinica TaxID=86752 RepID=UPI00265AEBC7|nr:sister chromatid cohesion protein PDS5 homolog C-like [Magnolia sinica]